MAVLEMQRINIYALKKHRKAILEALQRKGAVEIENLKLEHSVFSKEEAGGLYEKLRLSGTSLCGFTGIFSGEKISSFHVRGKEPAFR